MSKSLSYELKRKIDPLLRMQASDNDNERAAASGAITRLLRRAGTDWHNLTDALLAEPKASSSHTSWKRSSGPIDLSRERLLELLERVEKRTPALSIKSAGFVRSLRANAWRMQVRLSEKQWSWLQDLLGGDVS